MDGIDIPLLFAAFPMPISNSALARGEGDKLCGVDDAVEVHSRC